MKTHQPFSARRACVSRRSLYRGGGAAGAVRVMIAAALAILAFGCNGENDRTSRADDTVARKPSTEAPSRGDRPSGNDTLPNGESSSNGGSSSVGDTPRDSGSGRSPAGPSAGSRPKSRIDTIMVEGEPQPVRLRLLDEGLPFTTYFPEDEFTAESASSDEGIGIRFVARFGGTLNPDAYLTIFLPSAMTTVAAMEKFVTQHLIKSHGWRSKRAGAGEYCAWSKSSFAISGKSRENGAPIIGHICIGTHNGNAFYAMSIYPPEYADGFGPREALILSEMEWREEGER